jgi:quinohemoprotein ethanol dehydrogenase
MRGSGAPGKVTQARVLAEAGRGDNWLVNGGHFESRHFSPLKSITDRNVARLALAWAVDAPSPMGLSAEPIVVDGVVYLGAPFDKVFAIDAATGKLRWPFDSHIRINGPWRNSYEGRKNRGVAVWNLDSADSGGARDCRGRSQSRKAVAVRMCVEGNVSPMTPASIRRTHPDATLHLDTESAARLAPEHRGRHM